MHVLAFIHGPVGEVGDEETGSDKRRKCSCKVFNYYTVYLCSPRMQPMTVSCACEDLCIVSSCVSRVCARGSVGGNSCE